MRIAHENCFYFRSVGPRNAEAVFQLLINHHSGSKMAKGGIILLFRFVISNETLILRY